MSQEERIDLDKVREFMNYIGDRREGKYLREFVMS
jgi:hypothetical protein